MHAPCCPEAVSRPAVPWRMAGRALAARALAARALATRMLILTLACGLAVPLVQAGPPAAAPAGGASSLYPQSQPLPGGKVTVTVSLSRLMARTSELPPQTVWTWQTEGLRGLGHPELRLRWSAPTVNPPKPPPPQGLEVVKLLVERVQKGERFLAGDVLALPPALAPEKDAALGFLQTLQTPDVAPAPAGTLLVTVLGPTERPVFAGLGAGFYTQLWLSSRTSTDRPHCLCYDPERRLQPAPQLQTLLAEAQKYGQVASLPGATLTLQSAPLVDILELRLPLALAERFRALPPAPPASSLLLTMDFLTSGRMYGALLAQALQLPLETSRAPEQTGELPLLYLVSAAETDLAARLEGAGLALASGDSLVALRQALSTGKPAVLPLMARRSRLILLKLRWYGPDDPGSPQDAVELGASYDSRLWFEGDGRPAPFSPALVAQVRQGVESLNTATQRLEAFSAEGQRWLKSNLGDNQVRSLKSAGAWSAFRPVMYYSGLEATLLGAVVEGAANTSGIVVQLTPEGKIAMVFPSQELSTRYESPSRRHMTEISQNVMAIRTAEKAYEHEWDTYVTLPATPASLPKLSSPVPFGHQFGDNGPWDLLGWIADGLVRAQYEVLALICKGVPDFKVIARFDGDGDGKADGAVVASSGEQAHPVTLEALQKDLAGCTIERDKVPGKQSP